MNKGASFNPRQCTGPLSHTAPVDSEKTFMCSCSAAMRFGTTYSGSTIFARTGAFTVCSDSAASMSR